MKRVETFTYIGRLITFYNDDMQAPYKGPVDLGKDFPPLEIKNPPNQVNVMVNKAML